MDCNKVQDMMSLYMDDQLSAEEKKLFEEHIASCEDCKEELDFMQTIMSNVNDLNEEKELPADFHDNLMVKIDSINSTKKQTTSKMSRLNNLRRYYTAAAAVFVVVVIFGFIGISNLNQYKRDTENYSTSEAPADTARKESSKNEAIEKSSTEDTSQDMKTMDKPKVKFNEAKEDKKEELKDEQQENGLTFGTTQSDDTESNMAPTRITVEDSVDGKAAETENYQLEVSSEEKMDDATTTETEMVKDEPKSDNVEQNVEVLEEAEDAVQFDKDVGTKNQFTSVRGGEDTSVKVTNEVQEPEESNQWIIGTVMLIILCLLLLLLIIFKRLKKK